MVAGSLALCLAYAVVRYHVFGPVAWSHLPLYTFNKAVAFAAAILLASAYLGGNGGFARRAGLAGFGFAALHSLMSLALLSPNSYPKLFEDGRPNLAGGISILCGCLPLLVWILLAVFSIPAAADGLPPDRFGTLRSLGYWALGLTGAHVAAMGWKGWTEPRSWPAGIPPITLLLFVVVVLPLGRKMRLTPFWIRRRRIG